MTWRRRGTAGAVLASLTMLLSGGPTTAVAGKPASAGNGGGGSTSTATTGNFTCRASLVRGEGLIEIEPVVANPENDPCVAEDVALIDPLNPLTLGSLGNVRALFAQTTVGPGGSQAQSGAATANLSVGGITVNAAALTSMASASCTGSPTPALSGNSTVLFAQINGQTFVNVSDPVTIPLGPLGTVYLNQQTTTSDSVTQRALRVETPLETVTVAESIADFNGEPCQNGNGGGGGEGPPECSDERDNDGDGKIDFPNDPGCDSPQDDNETDGSEEPECSDGEDNDDDGRIDYPDDPGCDSREDDDETDGPGECKDGVDNDGDRKKDFPQDKGCKSPEDDDEAAGFITGGTGYDEADKKTLNEDFVNPGSSLRGGGVLPCDIGDNPGPNLNISWHNPQLQGQVKLDTLTRAFCRNDPFISPGNPFAEFDTYVGEGNGTFRDAAGVRQPVTMKFFKIDRGEPGAPPVIGVDFFEIHVKNAAGMEIATGVGTLDTGNVQAHSPGPKMQTRKVQN